MLSVGICDDDKETCEEICRFLKEYEQMTAEEIHPMIWNSGESLCEYFGRGETLPVLFLDIELISTDGVKVGKFLREELENLSTILIFISAKTEYAMQLFQLTPFDFLIKPITREVIFNTLARVKKQMDRDTKRFVYQTKGQIETIPFSDICYFMSDDKQIFILLKDEKREFRGKLKEISHKLPKNFIQIHKSYIINISFASRFTYETMVLQNGIELPISQSYRKEVRERLLRSFLS